MDNENSLPHWVIDAERMPIRFAQVREDALLDLDLLVRVHAKPIRVMMIGSGGCTAAGWRHRGESRSYTWSTSIRLNWPCVS